MGGFGTGVKRRYNALMTIREFVWPREEKIPTMEKKVNKIKIPRTDSIRQLADFWDKHDLTDFEDELEEVGEPVFSRRDSINLQLKPNQSKQIQRIAIAKGVPKPSWSANGW